MYKMKRQLERETWVKAAAILSKFEDWQLETTLCYWSLEKTPETPLCFSLQMLSPCQTLAKALGISRKISFTS